jgi:TorA maturation chaperone TorD
VTDASTKAAAIGVALPLAPEEQARADVYALLGRLFSDAPDERLLRALGRAERLSTELESPWPMAWNRLVDASSVMDAAAAAQEYTELFVGVGRSEVELHASHWLATASNRPLADLRGELAGLGIARRANATLMEDHLGPLLETMRFLVAGNPGAPPAAVAVQRAFLERWITSWADACCDAIERSSLANYYRRVAECTKTFLAIERDAFAYE